MFKISGIFQSEMQNINVIKSLNTWHCFYALVCIEAMEYSFARCDDTEFSIFLLLLCVCMHVHTHTHTHSLLLPPPNGTCTVTVFHWIKCEENFIFSSSAFTQAYRRRVKREGKVLLMIQFASRHQHLNFHFTYSPQLVHVVTSTQHLVGQSINERKNKKREKRLREDCNSFILTFQLHLLENIFP